ncbi:MAG TPA: LysM peptidoglycan-binding domain-containing protein [Thermoanaerobaculia bacterium]|nr:LysM peptidoglycan-binding domain-containing protein [Thermoanaerobaculia bacterium]
MAPFLLLVIATAAFAQPQSSTPPRELHRVGDHWTPYNPPDPATYPAGAKTHEIKAGDTLWALAQQYYGNAYLWPQLWESNTWITDAHWIYPGDVLLVEGEGAAAASTADGGTAETGEDGALDTVTPRSGTLSSESNLFTAQQDPDRGFAVARIQREARPIALATESDIYCYGYIGHPDEPMPNYVESYEDVETKYVPRAQTELAGSAAVGDLIYVHGGEASGLTAGETYLAVQPEELIRHPHTGAVIGRHYAYQGQIRILCTEGERSRAIVVSSCREIAIGTRLKPIPELPIPIERIPDLPQWCDPPSGRTTGTIVDSREWDLGLVEGMLIQIDLGRENQIQPGDFLTVFRPAARRDQPRQVLGQIGVLTAEARTATAVVLQARREMLVGDSVEMR